jgi:hypothetical protein
MSKKTTSYLNKVLFDIPDDSDLWDFGGLDNVHICASEREPG